MSHQGTPMADPDPLLPYVRAWRAARSAGRDPTPEELCPDRPDLIPRLAARIAALRKADVAATADPFADLDESPTRTLRPTADRGVSAPSPPPPARRPDHPSQVGNYRLLEQLGRGGMGAVYRAEDVRDGRQVALKLILPETVRDPVARARFLRESQVQAAVESEHVIPIIEVGEADGTPYLVMPLLRGETLEDRLKREPVPPLGVTLKVAREVAEGLAAADERGIVHRDIKPSNVWLEGDPSAADPAGRLRRCVILDFGLARATGVALHQLTTNRELFGTPAYMSPERANGAPVDIRSDLFSLGVILYEMATGRQPFESDNPFTVLVNVVRLDPPPARSVNPAVPAELSELIARMMAKEPDRRPASAREVADALRVLADQPGPPEESPPVPLPVPTPAVPDHQPGQPPTAFAPDPPEAVERTEEPAPTQPTADEIPPPEPPAVTTPHRPPPLRLWTAVGAVLVIAIAGVVWATGRGWLWSIDHGDRGTHTPSTGRGDDTPSPPPPSLDRLDRTKVPPAELWSGAPAELVAVAGSGVRQHFGGVGLVVPDPKRRWVATLGAAHPTRRTFFWDPNTLAPVGTLDWTAGEIGRLAVSRDGRTLAVGERFGRTELYDGSALPPRPRGRLPIPAATTFLFLPGGSLLTAEAGGRLTIWDVSGPAPRPRRTFTLPPLDFGKEASTQVQDLAVSADGKTLAVNCGGRTIRLWDVAADPPAERAVLHETGHSWYGAALGPAGRPLYTADAAADDSAQSVRAWRLNGATATPAEVIYWGGDSGYAEFALSPDGKQLAVSTLRAGVLRFDLSGAAPKPLPAIAPVDERGTAVRLAFDPDGRTLYTGGPALRAWDVSGAQPVEKAPFDPAARVTDAVLAADGTLVAEHADGKLRVWEPTGPTLTVRRELPLPDPGSVGKLVVTADASTAVRASGRTLTVWPLAAADAPPVRFDQPDAVSDLALTPDGRRLLTSTARTLTVWDRKSTGYAPRPGLRSVGAGWGRCAISPDGKWAAAVERQAGVRLFDAARDGLKPVLEVPNPAADVPIFSPDGHLLLITRKDFAPPFRYRLTDHGWVEEPLPAQVNSPRLHVAVFLADGRLLAGTVSHPGSDELRLEVWEAETGRVVHSVALPGGVSRLSAAADGRHLATRNDNGTAYLFRFSPP